MVDDKEKDKEPVPAFTGSEDDEQESTISKFMSGTIVLLAVAGFFGLAWYAYKNGGSPTSDKDVEVVKADTTPVKEAPTNPGGMDIPNQDKTVYGLIGTGKSDKQVVERILPAPETPVARTPGANTQTWMSDKLKTKAGESEEAQVAAQALTETPQTVPAKPVTPPAVTAAPAAPATPAAPAATPPAPKPKQPVAATDAQDDDDSAQPAAKPAAQTVTKPAAPVMNGNTRIQLGAYKSQEEAESNWKHIAGKFSAMSAKEHYILRVDLGEKGVFYRLQVGPFASTRDAAAACQPLTQAGQGCFPAKAK